MNKEERTAYGAKYRAEHKEEFATYNAKYKAEHKEELAANRVRYTAYNKEYSASHKKEEKTRLIKYRKEHKKEISVQSRKASLMKKYGMSIEEYDSLFTSQNGVCAICGSPPNSKNLAVDHDHETGKIRGLLCSNCNTGLGLLATADVLMKAADYLNIYIEWEKKK